MLIVLSMISVLLGIGLGVFSNLDKNLGGEIALEKLKSFLRLARNSAIRNGSPSYVILNSEKGSITGSGATIVGQWHLEDAEGAVGGKLSPSGGEFLPNGRFGGSLEFPSAGFLMTESHPRFDPRGGFSVEMYLKPTERRPMILFDMEGSYRLTLLEDGSLMAEVELSNGDLVSLDNPDVILPLGRWSRVGLMKNSVNVSILFDGLEVESAPVDGHLGYILNTPLSMGAEKGPIRGAIDEIRLYSLATQETFKLPENVSLVGPNQIVSFDRGGRLNASVHAGPTWVELRSETKEYRVEVGIMGSVR